jgi:signal transduction histidine kinase
MTSHELRNPLSAVVQCAESAMASLEQLRLPCHTSSPTEDGMADADGEINSAIDALQTIITCSLHQKRVIDDVLTLSKLDSDLIVITPVKVQPVVVILEAMKMFDVECKQSGIKLEFVEDSTAKHFEWVMLDRRSRSSLVAPGSVLRQYGRLFHCAPMVNFELTSWMSRGGAAGRKLTCGSKSRIQAVG